MCSESNENNEHNDQSDDEEVECIRGGRWSTGYFFLRMQQMIKYLPSAVEGGTNDEEESISTSRKRRRLKARVENQRNSLIGFVYDLTNDSEEQVSKNDQDVPRPSTVPSFVIIIPNNNKICEEKINISCLPFLLRHQVEHWEEILLLYDLELREQTGLEKRSDFQLFISDSMIDDI